MGCLCPVLLAFILNCMGVSIFRDKQGAGCEPLVSCLIFLLAIFILLWELRLYPACFRKLWPCGSKFLEFCVAMFIMEHMLADFWFPLDASLLAFLPKISDYEKDLLAAGGYNGDGVLQFLKKDGIGVIASYVMSVFFLCCALHATRMVDFRLIRCGFPTFLADINVRLRKFKKRMLKGPKCPKQSSKDFCECERMRLKAEKYFADDNDNSSSNMSTYKYKYDSPFPYLEEECDCEPRRSRRKHRY